MLLVLWLCWLCEKKGIWAGKTSSSKPFVMAVSVSGHWQDTARSILWLRRVLACPVRMLRIGMTGDKRVIVVADPHLPGKWLLKWSICLCVFCVVVIDLWIMIRLIERVNLGISGQIGRGSGKALGRFTCTECWTSLRELFQFRSNAVGAGHSTETCINAQFKPEPGHHSAGDGRPRLGQQETLRHDRSGSGRRFVEERSGTFGWGSADDQFEVSGQCPWIWRWWWWWLPVSTVQLRHRVWGRSSAVVHEEIFSNQIWWTGPIVTAAAWCWAIKTISFRSVKRYTVAVLLSEGYWIMPIGRRL